MKRWRAARCAGVVAFGILVAIDASAESTRRREPSVNSFAVAGCVTLTLGELEYHRNVALIRASLHVKQPMLTCGCVSSDLKYVARRADPDGDSTVLSIGALDTFKRQGKPVSVVLVAASDGAQTIDFGNVTISLDCL